MKALVTGGAGFIGSHLVEALLARGDAVRVLDNLSTGKRERVPASVEFMEGDITNIADVKSATEGREVVFHCAALPRVQLSLEKPQETHRANVDGTLNLLVAARDSGVRRVVYSASSSAYGAADTLPQQEDLPAQPLNPYALQKWIGEHYCRLFSSLFGLETVSLRYFNVYGPRMASEGAYATVIGVFMRQKKSGEPLTVAGDGEQTRDFTHVSDVVRANLLSAASPKVGRGEVINVGAGKDFSVNFIARTFGGPTQTIPPRPPGSEGRHSRADTRRAKELLGWEAAIAFSDGLRALLRENGVEPAAV